MVSVLRIDEVERDSNRAFDENILQVLIFENNAFEVTLIWSTNIPPATCIITDDGTVMGDAAADMASLPLSQVLLVRVVVPCTVSVELPMALVVPIPTIVLDVPVTLFMANALLHMPAQYPVEGVLDV